MPNSTQRSRLSSNKAVCILFFCCSLLSAQQAVAPKVYTYANKTVSDTAYGTQKQTDRMAAIEQQARQRGYTEQQINALKQRYMDQERGRSTQPPLPSQGQMMVPMKTPVSDSLLFSDSLFMDSMMIGDTLISDSTDTLGLDTSDTIKYFGYDLFRNVPDAFKPNAIGPIDPGYLVGPGDVLRLSVWGEVEFQYELKIDKEGKVFIPVAGSVLVTGIPFDQLQTKFKVILSKYYSGLASEPQKSFLDLSIAQMQPVRIFVMGELASPGGYTLSSASTAFNALYSVGGPLVSGSLRNITVQRDCKEIAKVDVYEYLVSGRCSTDVRLQNNDVVFIPRRGKTVTVIGSVFRPAIYELAENENILALMEYCGGLLPETNIEHALISRVVPFEKRDSSLADVEVVDVDMRRVVHLQEDIPLFDNDTLKITPLSYELRNFVLLKGAVHYPGMYECDGGLSMYRLIYTLGKPIDTKAFTRRADLFRRNEDCVTYTTVPIDLERLLNDSANYDRQLMPFDEVVIYEKEVEKPVDLLVTIDGEVRNPGLYMMSTNHTVVDVILQAGGFTRSAYRKYVDVYRMKTEKHGTDTVAEIFKVPLPDSLDYTDTTIGMFMLKDRDRIVVRPNPDYIFDNYVIVDGFVSFKGKYTIQRRGERLSDIVRRAGGLLPDAFLEGATVTRNKKRLVVNFVEALSGGTSKENIQMQRLDSIYIPQRPNTVLITGNVNNPGLFSSVEGNKVRSYIDRAGGFADSSSFILLTSPGGETMKIRKRSFRNPVVQEGSEIVVMKKVARDKTNQKQGPTIGEIIKDTLAIVVSAVTAIGLVIELRN